MSAPEVTDTLRELIRRWRGWRNAGDEMARAALDFADLARNAWAMSDAQLEEAEALARELGDMLGEEREEFEKLWAAEKTQ